ncbi:adenine phosphoribosyltransferase [Bifidobacterium pseudolongum]|uniref:Adenine phosphoribosyltransferase n=2 Tax=Bifidobacterium pseudolongum TaxID=1694 RepID=A0A4Q5A6Y1_9BIFI|nr:adenine phosphoribosyltransferase [Bifidobacterium pseudolongum]RYQ19463.1 adenine phosphoribosyltransferase [Bifidobacterium pseudolongum subsp. globosum]RYQ20395.1 adenine phosphoribosyltransferase [Bifidobacterium pseudolongum subsp. pseudolongum]RYQ43606.1 adenine phosphoribosyltransferase [Bifidobacterium pseudolongum subsp. globosum]
MTHSDITLAASATLDAADADYLISLIRSVPGFPKQGIMFRDFMPVFADARGLRILLDALKANLPVGIDDFDAIAGLEARGFLFGPAMAAELGKGFIAVRKAGKLPPPTCTESYSLEYGEASIEIEREAIAPGERILIVDDLIATGGSASAARDLVIQCGGTVAGLSFVMELLGLQGLQALGDYPTSSLLTMPA